MDALAQRIAELSPAKRELLARRLREKSDAAPQAIPRRAAPAAPSPLSFAQERVWIFEQLEPGTASYNMPTALRLSGALDRGALERCLREIARRHEVLRATFVPHEATPRQVVSAEAEVSLPVVDLSGLPTAERDERLRREIFESARRPFDLQSAPAWRASLLRLGEREHVALLTMHHIIFDGWSMAVLMREVAALYEAFVEGRESPLPELPIQYADYATWQRERARGGAFEPQLDYWRRQLEGVGELGLRTDRPRPPAPTFRGERESLRLAESLKRDLKALGREHSATFFMTMLAAFKLLLFRHTGRDDIAVGTPIANRRWVEVEGLIGFFLNTLVLRTDVSGNPTFVELLARVRRATSEAYRHQDLPFDQLVDALRPEREAGRYPFFDVFFVLHNNPLPRFDLPRLSAELIAVNNGVAKFDLELFVNELDEGVDCAFLYNPDLFDAATVRRMLADYEELLRAAAERPDARLLDAPPASGGRPAAPARFQNSDEFDFDL